MVHMSKGFLQLCLWASFGNSVIAQEQGCDTAVALQSANEDAFMTNKLDGLPTHPSKKAKQTHNPPSKTHAVSKGGDHVKAVVVNEKVTFANVHDQDHRQHGKQQHHGVGVNTIQKNHSMQAKAPRAKSNAVLVGAPENSVTSSSLSLSNMKKSEDKGSVLENASEVRPQNLAEMSTRRKRSVPNLDAINATIEPAVAALASANDSIVSAFGTANDTLSMLLGVLTTARQAAANPAIQALGDVGRTIDDFCANAQSSLGDLQRQTQSALDSAIAALADGVRNLASVKDKVFAALQTALDKANECNQQPNGTSLLQQKTEVKAKSDFWPGGGQWPWGCGPFGSCFGCASVYVGKANRTIEAASKLFDTIMEKTNSTIAVVSAKLSGAANATMVYLQDKVGDVGAQASTLLSTVKNNFDKIGSIQTKIDEIAAKELPGMEKALADAKDKFSDVFSVTADLLDLANTTAN